MAGAGASRRCRKTRGQALLPAGYSVVSCRSTAYELGAFTPDSHMLIELHKLRSGLHCHIMSILQMENRDGLKSLLYIATLKQ